MADLASGPPSASLGSTIAADGVRAAELDRSRSADWRRWVPRPDQLPLPTRAWVRVVRCELAELEATPAGLVSAELDQWGCSAYLTIDRSTIAVRAACSAACLLQNLYSNFKCRYLPHSSTKSSVFGLVGKLEKWIMRWDKNQNLRWSVELENRDGS